MSTFAINVPFEAVILDENGCVIGVEQGIKQVLLSSLNLKLKEAEDAAIVQGSERTGW